MTLQVETYMFIMTATGLRQRQQTTDRPEIQEQLEQLVQLVQRALPAMTDSSQQLQTRHLPHRRQETHGMTHLQEMFMFITTATG
jgi:hypothetical protein